MYHHILVKWNADVTDKREMAEKAAAAFADATKIAGIRECRLFPNCVDRENRYDLMIRLAMTKEALPAYDESEMHKAWKRDFGAFIDKKAIFDCEE